jgi:serine/threonine kinase 38
MDSARGWLQKLQRDKDKGKPGMSAEGGEGDGEVVSSASKQKAEAAKQCIENHYREQARSMQERKERSVSSVLSLCPRITWSG